jgi:endonuclease/exonuclease/phosphatase family metal-dependent hydrolase
LHFVGLYRRPAEERRKAGMNPAKTLRVMTYNVHRCVGRDGRALPERIAAVIAHYNPDVVALQELDVGHSRTARQDQPAAIAACLGMQCFFFPAVSAADEHYGDAVLSRLPLRLIRKGPLPVLKRRRLLERRGAIWTAVDANGRTVQLLNTHLSLNRRERLIQIDALLGAEWLGHAHCTPPRLLCGDFNAPPGSLAYRRLRRAMRDVQTRPGGTGPQSTFPARCPLLCLDHIFHSSDIGVRETRVGRGRQARLASDHLPVVAEVVLP